MKKLVEAHLLFIVLLFALITSAYASVTMQAVIDQDVCVTFDFKNVTSTVYWKIKNENLINESSIPNIILGNLRQQNLTHVGCYVPKPLDFNDSALSLRVTFCLYGSDILNFTVNTKSMNRTYYVRTDWRNFQLNVTDGFFVDFDEYFGSPISHYPPSSPSFPWQIINYTDSEGKIHLAYFCNHTDSNSFDPLCYFVLPTEASNIHAVRDTIIFELPASFEDSLLNSPFLILGAIVVGIIAFSLYRKVRK